MSDARYITGRRMFGKGLKWGGGWINEGGEGGTFTIPILSM